MREVSGLVANEYFGQKTPPKIIFICASIAHHYSSVHFLGRPLGVDPKSCLIQWRTQCTQKYGKCFRLGGALFFKMNERESKVVTRALKLART